MYHACSVLPLLPLHTSALSNVLALRTCTYSSCTIRPRTQPAARTCPDTRLPEANQRCNPMLFAMHVTPCERIRPLAAMRARMSTDGSLSSRGLGFRQTNCVIVAQFKWHPPSVSIDHTLAAACMQASCKWRPCPRRTTRASRSR
jgi:hypothetical protein